MIRVLASSLWTKQKLPLFIQKPLLLEFPLPSEALQLFPLTLERCAGLLNLLLLLALPLLLSLELVSEEETGTKPEQAPNTGTSPSISCGASNDSA